MLALVKMEFTDGVQDPFKQRLARKGIRRIPTAQVEAYKKKTQRAYMRSLVPLLGWLPPIILRLMVAWSKTLLVLSLLTFAVIFQLGLPGVLMSGLISGFFLIISVYLAFQPPSTFNHIRYAKWDSINVENGHWLATIAQEAPSLCDPIQTIQAQNKVVYVLWFNEDPFVYFVHNGERYYFACWNTEGFAPQYTPL